MIEQKELNEIIRQAIDKNCYLKTVKKDNGEFHYFETEIDTEWNDIFSDKQIEKILDSKNPMDEFYDIINDLYIDSEFYEHDYIFDQCITDTREAIEGMDLQENVELEDYVREYIYEIVYINYPHNHYLKQDIRINISTDFYNESNTDFTYNSFFLDGIPYQKKLPRGSITWLVQSQGYTMTDLYNHYYGTKKSDSEFIKSVSEELDNATYSMQLLTFFTTMTLEEVIQWNANRWKKNAKKLKISKDLFCGLYNPWNGSGSVLGIKLEKDIYINPKNIHSLASDGSLGYGINEIYGMSNSFWEGR